MQGKLIQVGTVWTVFHEGKSLIVSPLDIILNRTRLISQSIVKFDRHVIEIDNRLILVAVNLKFENHLD